MNMNLYNQNKQQLISAIKRQIEQIDCACSHLTSKIYKSSDDRLRKVQEAYAKSTSQNNELRIIKISNQKNKKEKLFILKELLLQENILKQQLNQKQQQIKFTQKQLMFVQEKNMEQQPHVQKYLQEKNILCKTNNDIHYAKNKLKTLQKMLQKESQKMEYKYRLITLIKQELRRNQHHYMYSVKNNRKQGELNGDNNFNKVSFSHLGSDASSDSIPRQIQQSQSYSVEEKYLPGN